MVLLSASFAGLEAEGGSNRGEEDERKAALNPPSDGHLCLPVSSVSLSARVIRLIIHQKYESFKA